MTCSLTFSRGGSLNMAGSLALLLTCAVAGCAQAQAAPTPAPAAAESASTASGSTASAPVASAPTPMATAPAAEIVADAPVPTPAPQLTPSSPANGFVVHASGCLAADPSAEGGAKFPASAPRGMGMQPAKDEVTVAREGGSLLISHKLSHACCLQLSTETSREGSTLVLHESLSGHGCRCMCASKLDFTVAAGDATALRIETQQGTGTVRTAFSGAIPSP